MQELADLLFTLAPDAYDRLVTEEGWSAQRFETWLARPPRPRLHRLAPPVNRDPGASTRACSRMITGEEGEEPLCVTGAWQVVEHHVGRRPAVDQVPQPAQLVFGMDVPQA